MRPEKLYLTDILEAAEAIARFCLGVTYADFASNDMRRSAVLQKLIVIGEAAAHLPDKFFQAHLQVPWQDVIGFRNIAVHEYFAIQWEIVWVAATEDVPELYRQVQKILAEEFKD
jgi:uncharacterized protein with HEPN domain